MSMPDWKNDKEYEFTTSLTPEGWAWEFLRRNPEYQADYQRLKASYDALEEKYGPLDDTTAGQRDTDPLSWHHEPDRLLGEDTAAWCQRALKEDAEPKRTPLDKYISSKWGIKGFPPDPSTPADPPPKFNEIGPYPLFPGYHAVGDFFEGDYPKTGPDGEEDWCMGAGPYAQKYGYAVVVFALELPLGPQLKIAKNQLKSLTKLQKKNNDIDPLTKYTSPDALVLFLRYLRLLDGAAAGATLAQMGPVLFGWKGETRGSGDEATSSAWDSLQAAKMYRDRRYLMIPQMKLPPPSDQKAP